MKSVRVVLLSRNFEFSFPELVFSVSSSSSKISIDGININLVDEVKFLGLYLDSRLSWKQHVSSVSLTVSRNIGIISKLRRILPCTAMLTLYNTLILPHLMFCIIIWGNAGVTT